MTDTSKQLNCVVSISGMRGIVGDTMDVGLALELAQAYGSAIADGGTVILGRDSRPTGAMFAQAVAAGLRSVGCNVIDIGIVPTPTVPIMMSELSAAGGIQISASHNPVEWNALKYFAVDNEHGGARNVDQGELDTMLAAFRQGVPTLPWSGCGSYAERTDACAIHQQKVLDLIDTTDIQAAAPTVLIDSVNGSGSIIAPALLRALGCQVHELYTNPYEIFPRDPEPTAANVVETGQRVVEVGAAVGFVQDPDADRLAIIDEKGVYIGEEYTLVLCAAARLAQIAAEGVKNAVICTNLSTSRMLEDVAASFGAQVIRTPVGEANVVVGMRENNAAMGGEGNGGIIDPRIVKGRDSQIGMALIVDYMVRSGQTMSELVAAIPQYSIHKEKIAMSRETLAARIDALVTSELVAGAQCDHRDGWKFIWEDRWLHVRASGTEPASRIITEAPDSKTASTLAADARSLLDAELITGH